MPDLQTILQLLKANPRAMYGPGVTDSTAVNTQTMPQPTQPMPYVRPIGPNQGNPFRMGPNDGQIPVQDLQQLFGTRGSDQ